MIHGLALFHKFPYVDSVLRMSILQQERYYQDVEDNNRVDTGLIVNLPYIVNKPDFRK